MKLKINKIIPIPEIPSASGIAKFGDHYFVIGDDSPFLFEVDASFQLVQKIKLFEENDLTENRIPKAKKPDFEALEIIDNKELIIFGSGSKSPQRNLLIRVDLESMEVKKTDISLFYQNLQTVPEMADVELNIEATTFKDELLYLFNRSNNLMLMFEYTDFIDFVDNNSLWKQPTVCRFSLPKIKNIESKFSGATVFENDPYIVFTSSVEDTENAYDDGEILGSFVGIINLSAERYGEIQFQQVPQKDVPLKVESVALLNAKNSRQTQIVLVTDNDGGVSELLECEIAF